MSSLLEMLGVAKGDMLSLGFLTTVFLAVALAIYGVSALWASGSSVRRRISGDVVAQRAAGGHTESLSFLEEAARMPAALELEAGDRRPRQSAHGAGAGSPRCGG